MPPIPLIDISCVYDLCHDERFARRSPSDRLSLADMAAAIQRHLFQGGCLRSEVRKCASAVLSALSEIGFMYISGHHIDKSVEKAMDQLSREFFRKPIHEKMTIEMAKGGRAWRGYFPVAGELTSGKPDLKEGIYFGQQIRGSDSRHGAPLFGNNMYPLPDGSWSAVVESYMSQCEATGQALLVLLALAMEQDALTFVRFGVSRDPLGLFRIFHYPPSSMLPDSLRSEVNWGVGEHTDYGLLTLLRQDSVGGLEVRTTGGEWTPAPPIDGTLVVNVGDMLEAITSGLLMSTPHRVRNTSPESMRVSFPYFFDPDVSFLIRPFPLPEKFRNLAASQVVRRNQRRIKRWDGGGVAVASLIGDTPITYGKYLTNKVSKVFPALASSQL